VSKYFWFNLIAATIALAIILAILDFFSLVKGPL
jgi:hypothetical protein